MGESVSGHQGVQTDELKELPARYFFAKVPLTEAFNRTIFMSAPKPSDEIFPQRGLPWLSIR